MLGRKQNGLDDSDMVTIRSYDLPYVPVVVPVPADVPVDVPKKAEPEAKQEEVPQATPETNEHTSLQNEMDKLAQRRIQAQQIDAEAEADYQTDDTFISSAPAPAGQKTGQEKSAIATFMSFFTMLIQLVHTLSTPFNTLLQYLPFLKQYI